MATNVHDHWAQRPRPCGATRPALIDAGWECTGRGLVVLIVLAGQRLPVVLPRRALEIIDPDPWWELPVKDFTGGDHLHLVVPRRPNGLAGKVVFPIGDAMAPFYKLGTAATTKPFIYGPPE